MKALPRKMTVIDPRREERALRGVVLAVIGTAILLLVLLYASLDLGPARSNALPRGESASAS